MIDLLDKKILHTIDYDARIPLSALAKKVKQSKQTTAYRLKRLEQRGIRVHLVSSGEFNIDEVECLTEFGDTDVYSNTDILFNNLDFYEQLCEPLN